MRQSPSSSPSAADGAASTSAPGAPTAPRRADGRPANRLARETSAYLRQHQWNPVDWHPWGAEAFERARREDKPLLVSIGYSACHWCHVMERESFEDASIAARMNEVFVCIKVDREERPDVDQIYMDTALKLNGQGGWPLNVACTPDGRPFFVGTYFPPARRGGMPGFPDVLDAIAEAWRTRRAEIDANAGEIARAIAARPTGPSDHRAGPETVVNTARLILQGADRQHGGFGQGSKFPTATNLELLVCALDFLPGEEATATARFLALTAREMARRGLFDQLGGGFHRYCVDASWTVPHFEKMLYDQGQLLAFYAELARRSHAPADFVWPIQETIAYLRREMTGEGGAWYASQDADSEGVEGRYFVWTPEQIEAVLGPGADAFRTAYGVRPRGNFEHGTTQLVDEARAPRATFAAERARLLAARQERIAPATDRKHVAAWNGYAISGLARAASLLADEAILEDAVRAADFVLDRMVVDGRLMRVHDAGRAHVEAFLDDHAAMLTACLDLQRAGAGDRFLTSALQLAHSILARFADPASGVLYLTPADGEQADAPLIHRPRPDHDGATPDAAGLALLGLARLGALSHSEALETFVERALVESALLLERAPHAFPTLVRAVALRSRGLAVAVVIGDSGRDDTLALAERARRVLRPEDAVLVIAPGSPRPPGVAAEWVAGREMKEGRATAWLCRGTSCSLPVQAPSELVAELLPGV
ncbi:MAG: thioredoxin domain-containing protein [Myxococcota bacterium]